MENKDKALRLVEKTEEENISREVMVWINKCPYVPDTLYRDIVLYENLKDDQECMAISTIQGTYITKRYILGGHQAEYQFKIIYRVKPGSSIDGGLQADELLDKIGQWACDNLPYLGEGIRTVRVRVDARAAIFAAYTNGDEDHQILMTLTYEVT